MPSTAFQYRRLGDVRRAAYTHNIQNKNRRNPCSRCCVQLAIEMVMTSAYVSPVSARSSARSKSASTMASLRATCRRFPRHSSFKFPNRNFLQHPPPLHSPENLPRRTSCRLLQPGSGPPSADSPAHPCAPHRRGCGSPTPCAYCIITTTTAKQR